MEKALNEIGKLRNEMKVGFIELENQMKVGNETIVRQMEQSNQLFIQTLGKFSKKVETGFLAIEESLGAR